jgi:hypothetical protein
MSSPLITFSPPPDIFLELFLIRFIRAEIRIISGIVKVLKQDVFALDVFIRCSFKRLKAERNAVNI